MCVCVPIYIYIYIYIYKCLYMYIYISVCVYICLYNMYIYIYINACEEKLKNKVIQSEEFNMKGSRCYNILVSINDHQDLEKMLSSVV